MNKSIILLSGGLDSLVCLGLCNKEYNIQLALTFDYGQKSAQKEIDSAQKLCKYYEIQQHKIIRLDWLKEITTTALVTNKNIPKNQTFNKNTANSVWVPNRNGLFLNIAGAIADSENYSHIIIGANKEEAETFSDNTTEFIESINREFEYSTHVHPKVIVPLINYNKNDIVSLALKNKMPLEMVRSCYDNNENHCGQCESCTRLKNALIYNKDTYYRELLFKD